MAAREVVPGPKPGGPYSPGIVAEGRFVFVSGQGPVRDGVYVPSTIEEETRLTLDNLLTVLAASGSGPEHVVRCGVWLTDLADFAEMNSVYAEVFPRPEAGESDRPGNAGRRPRGDRLHRGRPRPLAVLPTNVVNAADRGSASE